MDDELEAMLVEAYQRGWREGCETLLEDEEREGVAAMPHKDAMGEGCGTFVMEISPRLTRIASRLEADEDDVEAIYNHAWETAVPGETSTETMKRAIALAMRRAAPKQEQSTNGL